MKHHESEALYCSGVAALGVSANAGAAPISFNYTATIILSDLAPTFVVGNTITG
jgi:hypothetical protein